MTDNSGYGKLPNESFIFRGNMSLADYELLNRELAREGPRLRLGPVLDPLSGEYRSDLTHLIGSYLGEFEKNTVKCVVKGERITLADAISAQLEG